MENAPKSTELDTIVIEKVKGVTDFLSPSPATIVFEKLKYVSDPPSPSPATSPLHEAGSVTRVVGQSLKIAAAPSLDPVTAGVWETQPASRGVHRSWHSAMRALGMFLWVGEQ